MAGSMEPEGLFQTVDPKSKEFLDIAASWNLPCPILAILKVNNSRLLRKYQFIRSEISLQVGADNVNDAMLWHGTSGPAAEIIAAEGFDHRVGVKNGRVYGDGIYFTQDAVLALRYSLGDEDYKKMANFLKRQSIAFSRFVFGTPTPFVPRTDTETVVAKSSQVAENLKISYQAITLMREYETKSFEELRIEDYAANRRGKVVPFAVTTHIDVDLGYEDELLDEDYAPYVLTGKGRLHSIEVMPDFVGKTSEEIRMEDYRLKRRGVRIPFQFVEMDEEEEEEKAAAEAAEEAEAAEADKSLADDRSVLIFDGASSSPKPKRRKLRYQSINLMPVYADDSFEELRMEDYKNGRKGGKVSSLSAGARASGGAGRPSPPARRGGPKDVNMKPTTLFAPSSLASNVSSIFNPNSPSTSQIAFHLTKNSLQSAVNKNFPSSSTNLLPSNPFSFPNKSACMIYARVTLGVSTPGQASYTRPPPIDEKDLTRGRYNSCTGKLLDQSVFVVFDNAQAFPEYLVQYEMDDAIFAS